MSWRILFGMIIFVVQMDGFVTHITMGVERIVQISSFMVTQMMMSLLGHHYSWLQDRTIDFYTLVITTKLGWLLFLVVDNTQVTLRTTGDPCHLGP